MDAQRWGVSVSRSGEIRVSVVTRELTSTRAHSQPLETDDLPSLHQPLGRVRRLKAAQNEDDPPSAAGRHQLGLLRRGETRLEPAIDSVLATPVVDRLVTDPEILGDLRDLAAGLDQIQHPPTELRRIATLPHAVLLQDSSIRVQLRDSTKAPADHAA
jgi:hypothetical protein